MPHQTCVNDSNPLFCFKLHFVRCYLKWLSINKFQMTCSISVWIFTAELRKVVQDTDQHQMTFYSIRSQKHHPVLSNANQRKWRLIQSCTKIRTQRQLKGEFYSLLTSVVDTPEVKKVHRWCWGLMCKYGWNGSEVWMKLHRHAFHWHHNMLFFQSCSGFQLPAQLTK